MPRNSFSNLHVPQVDGEILTAELLRQIFYTSTINSNARVQTHINSGHSYRGARHFLLSTLRTNFCVLLSTQTPRVLLDLITELGLFSRLKSLLKFLQVTHRKKKVGQILPFDRKKICEFFFTSAVPNHNIFVAFCALTCLMDFDEAALTEQEQNERKAILEIMKKSVLRSDIFLYLQLRHQCYFLATNDVFSPTDVLFQQTFDWYCINFSWFKVVDTYIRNHRRPDAVAPEPEQPPAEIV